MAKRKNQCVVGSCRRIGYGNPVLCEDHENVDIEYMDEVVNSVMNHPQSKEVAKKLDDIFIKAQEFLAKLQRGEIPIGPAAQPKVIQPKLVRRDPREVLHFGPKEILTEQKIMNRVKQLAKFAHPDAEGGSHERMIEINGAAEILKKALNKKVSL